MGIDTTLESHDSIDGSKEERRLALLWLFPQAQTHLLQVGQGPWDLGRDGDCEVFVEDRKASRRHARISFKGPVVVLKDLDSTNGTFVDGTRIDEVPVRAGTIVRIGEHVGTFCMAPSVLDGEPCFRELLPGYYVGPGLTHILPRVRRAAQSDLPISIVGDTGTGKERLAEFIHRESGRAGPFHAINCAAIPTDLAESQLFGHREGAFTGARHTNIGHFRAANGGTLFLDEITELPLPLQAKLLRVLEERRVTALGDTKPVPVDVRIVTASQRALTTAAGDSSFRADLQARLSGFTVNLPNLIERREEVPFLFISFLRRYSSRASPRVEGKLIEALCLYSWPGNVRELELLARQLLAVHDDGEVLKRSHLPAAIGKATATPSATSANAARADLERLVRALRNSGGNISRASASIGMSRARAYRLMGTESISSLMGKYRKGDLS